MIRDKIVVGIRDQSLSERLQLDPTLTLDKAKTLTQQRKAIYKQQTILSKGKSGQLSQVEAIKHKGTQKANNTDGRRNQTAAKRTAKAACQT